MPEVNFDVAMENYRKRKAAYQGKQINNSALHAGSPMHYYCKFCYIQTEVLPESHTRTPKVRCTACDVLEQNGFLPELPPPAAPKPLRTLAEVDKDLESASGAYQAMCNMGTGGEAKGIFLENCARRIRKLQAERKMIEAMTRPGACRSPRTRPVRLTA